MYQYVKSKKNITDIQVGDKVRCLRSQIEDDVVGESEVLEEGCVLTISKVITNKDGIPEGVFYEEVQTSQSYWCSSVVETFQYGYLEIVDYKDIYSLDDFKKDIQEIQKNEKLNEVPSSIVSGIMLELCNEIGNEVNGQIALIFSKLEQLSKQENQKVIEERSQLNIEKYTFEDGITALENAIVEKYGFSYNSDSANISWRDLGELRYKIRENPDKYLFVQEEQEQER